MQSSIFKKQLFWGIKVWQLLMFFSVYAIFACQYWLAIYFTSNGYSNIWKEAIIDYFFLKAMLTLPLWWLYFIKLKSKALAFKIMLHLFTGPVWVGCWFYGYRFIQDLRGSGYLSGNGKWWDVYIPGLVYYLQFAVFHAYDFYLQTQHQKEKEKQLMQAAYNSEVSALKAQIQPHFLFNTLNSISASVPKEMEHTRELIAKLADTFRYSLQASEQEFILLQHELDFTKVTLDLEKERLKKRLELVYNIDETLLQTKVPPMLLQPITENAIKHGIAPNINGGCITIAIQKLNGKVNICISDTGIGYVGELNDHLLKKGIGLRNTNMRLEKLYSEKIIVERNQPTGLKFSFNIPL
ncbi:MAG: histidine kinase [Deinococcales bacterium]|nr:histidine kinase [Chitinophagaceae bacterium]